MSELCHHRETCRLCGGTDLTEVLSLAPTPPANAFVPTEKLDEAQETFPLDLFFCEGCGHVQLLDVVDPRVLFESYVYVSDTSPVFVEHFRGYADFVVDAYRPDPSKLVLDIGSNDGTLLGFFKDRGFPVLGVDPAKATTLMYHFGIGPDVIDFIVNDSPLKQGLYTPGLHVPVLPSDTLYQRKPDYVVILAWNFARPIMDKHVAYTDAGGRFIVPLPQVEIY